jgi:hypothetical protein
LFVSDNTFFNKNANIGGILYANTDTFINGNANVGVANALS